MRNFAPFARSVLEQPLPKSGNADSEIAHRFWKLDRDLLVACGIEKSAAAGTILSNPTLVSRGTVSGTILAITFLERKMGGEKDTWELIVDKAKGWLQSNGVEMEKEVEADPLKALLSGL